MLQQQQQQPQSVWTTLWVAIFVVSLFEAEFFICPNTYIKTVHSHTHRHTHINRQTQRYYIKINAGRQQQREAQTKESKNQPKKAANNLKLLLLRAQAMRRDAPNILPPLTQVPPTLVSPVHASFHLSSSFFWV